MNIGIVGHEAKKFTPHTEAIAKELIRQLLEVPEARLISGHCPLGGIDVWAEEIALTLGKPKLIFPPAVNNWAKGYKPRNILIAEHSDIVHNILVAKYPPGFDGLRHEDPKTGEPYCYHCHTTEHVKSGGCWTARYAQELGKEAQWHIILDE
jgi:hypothetical protein